MSVNVRAFQRRDRDQLTALVNAHASAVVPGLVVSVNAVMSQLEREPGEFIVDPWVRDRATLVAEQRDRVVAAAHLLRYADDGRVGDSYRDAGEIRWFLYWPEAPYWPDSTEAGDVLLAACLVQLERWGVTRRYADGALPAPAVYGVPEQWPHIRAAYERAGFEPGTRTEILFVADVGALPKPSEPPVTGLTVRRSVGVNGTRFAAVLDRATIGFIEVETLEEPGRLPRHRGWADIGNLEVVDEHRSKGVGTWLLAHAGEWLRLAGVERLLAYASPGENDCASFYARSEAFRELTRTTRGWQTAPMGPTFCG
jgi:GNAT superfamily N-acetyltransferase